MNTSSSGSQAEAETMEVAAEFTTLFNKGLQRMVELSKSSLDLVVEQNTEVLDSCKQALQASTMPSLFLLKLADQAFASCVTLQKSLLDLTVEQSAAGVEAAQEYSYDVAEAEAVASHQTRQLVNRTNAARKPVVKRAKRSKSKR